MKKIKWIIIGTLILTILVFVMERVDMGNAGVVTRNTYGSGSRTEEYEVTVEDELEKEPVKVEVQEQKYTHAEIQKLFREITDKLDQVVLGENESFDRVEKDLHLVGELPGYPMRIEWQLSSYDVLNTEGEILYDNVKEEGSLVELRGTISYEGEKTIYVRNAMVYPLTRAGADKLLYEIQEEIKKVQEKTREDETFSLPEEDSGRTLTWSQKKESKWYYVLLLGVGLSAVLLYREREQVRQKEQKRKEALLREYPGMISKFTMLLGTGTTVKGAWEKIVQNYEKQKKQSGLQSVYEEMKMTLHEMQGGVPEAEAYERFGKRCGNTTYLKFGTLLSQNLRKGSKGVSEILRMEASQAFENRKSTARRLGEEAGTKLLMPMIGMLAVVFLMVMVPAFMSMQI